MAELVPAELIQQRILVIRGKRVLLDADLARFYGVGTRELNRAVSRNSDRFPEDFAFKLTLEETRALMFQVGTSKPSHPRSDVGGTLTMAVAPGPDSSPLLSFRAQRGIQRHDRRRVSHWILHFDQNDTLVILQGCYALMHAGQNGSARSGPIFTPNLSL